MRDDEVCRAIEGDDLIMRFGQRLYEEQGHHPHRLPYVAQKMRDLGGLLNVLMSSDIYSHEDAMRASRWDSLFKGVKIVSEFDNSTQTYGIPSLALKHGYSLQKCAEDLYFIDLRNED